MGLYNRRKLSNLREQVETVAARQNRLLQIMAVMLKRLDTLETLMAKTIELLSEDIDLTMIQRKIRMIRDQLQIQYQQIVRAIQAAHQRCLSVDLLNTSRLQDLFHGAQRRSDQQMPTSHNSSI